MAEKRKNNVGLNTLKPGEKGRIAGMALGKGIGEKLQDMGFLQGSLVECAYRSPFGDPTAYFEKVLESLLDEESHMISTNYIDEVSSITNSELDELITMEIDE